MNNFAARGAEPIVIASSEKPRTSWWTVAEGGEAFARELAAARARMACDPHIRMPDLSHLKDARRGGR